MNVDIENFLDFGRFNVENWFDLTDFRIVDHDIQVAQRFCVLAKAFRELVPIADIGCQRHGFAAECLNFLCCFGQNILFDIQQNDVRALLGQTKRSGLANTLGCTRNGGCFSRKGHGKKHRLSVIGACNAVTAGTIDPLFRQSTQNRLLPKSDTGLCQRRLFSSRRAVEEEDFRKDALTMCFRACKDALNKRYYWPLAGFDEPFREH